MELEKYTHKSVLPSVLQTSVFRLDGKWEFKIVYRTVDIKYILNMIIKKSQ
jgi:hypothetical protein